MVQPLIRRPVERENNKASLATRKFQCKDQALASCCSALTSENYLPRSTDCTTVLYLLTMHVAVVTWNLTLKLRAEHQI